MELATGAIWALMAWRHPLELEALRGALFFTMLLGIALTDVRDYIIPDEFSFGGLGHRAALRPGGGPAHAGPCARRCGHRVRTSLADRSAGSLLFKKEAMGGGDIKMMAMVGAFVGWQGVLLTIFLGALLGTIIFLPLKLIGPRREVPFGVFLSIGAAAAWLVGTTMIAWYRAYIGL